jgi:hypothetical protein
MQIQKVNSAGRSTISAIVLIVGLTGVACHPRLDYRLPEGALVPVGWSAPLDQRETFAKRFCAAVPSEFGTCDRWLRLPRSLDISHVDTWADAGPKLDTSYRIVAVGGIFSDCLNDVVTTFQDALEHLKLLGFDTEYWRTCADCTTAENGAELVKQLHKLPAGTKVIAVGHSKGAVDLIDAVSQDEHIGDILKAVLTVNSPVSGTRLADIIPHALSDLSKRIGTIGTCNLGSGQGLDSLKRRERQRFWAAHPNLPGRTAFFSLVSASTRERTSPVMLPLWDPMSQYSLDQDSQVIAEEGIVPGGTYLGQLKGDHWAPAFPIETVPSPLVKSLFEDKNHFPRGAMLEAAVRVVIESMRPSR